MEDKWQKVREIFGDALRHKPEERRKFIIQACGKDQTLLVEVESLLSSLGSADSFLETPAVGMVADAFEANTKELGPGKSFGHYEIVKQIGEGGMGEVYLAQDKKLDRKVAVKILNEHFSKDESNLQRFIREAKTASALNHPNILVVHDVGESGEAHYIVSEFIKGKTLREKLKESQLSFAEVLDIAIQTASALAAAHEANLVHRDIKPENIMIRPDGFVKVLDFGLAKLVEQKNKTFLGLENSTVQQSPTAKGVILGTINYMSPEQARGKDMDARTDIWSLGIVLYEMLTGRTPFAGETTSDTISAVLNKNPAPIAATVPDIPKEMERIVGKTLRKEREERYQHIKDLLVDLKDLKQELEFSAKLERSNAPSTNDKTAVMTAVQMGQTTSSAEYIVGEIKQHKRGVLAILAVLLVATIGFGYWFFSNPAASINTGQIKSLAVLPFKPLDASENHLGLGIADALIRRISQTGKLIVRPTSAVRRYLNEETDALAAARQLEVDAVIEGAVQRTDDHLRVSVNLLRVSDGASLWADQFDLRASDIFTIQDTMAQQVASRLQLRLDPAPQARLAQSHTANAVAYEYYLKGVYGFDQRGWVSETKPQMETTVNFFRKAIEVDPNYALAHAQLAYAYAWTALFVEPTEPSWAERAKEQINRAQALDSQLAETYLARSLLLWSAYGNFQNEDAIRELLAAQKLNPNVGHAELAFLYAHMGLTDLAERAQRHALDIDPTSEFLKEQTLIVRSTGGRYDEWFAAHQKLRPGKPPDVWYLLRKGRLEEAQKRIEEMSAKESAESWDLTRTKAMLAALKGNFRAAEALIPAILSENPRTKLTHHHAAYDIACIYALEGKSSEAVKWLREAAATGYPNYPLFERDAYLNRIRQTPEFGQFMAEMKAQFEKYKRKFAQ